MSRIVALFLLLISGGCVATAVLAPPAPAGKAQSQSAAGQPSDLVFEPSRVDMGTVREGEPATAVLRLRNAGQQMLEIADVQASCGCTTAEPQDRLLMPGAFTLLRVRVDTFAKQDGIQKTILVTDSLGHTARATLTLKVLPNAHMAMSGRSIFDKPCASCHYDPAIGKRSGAAIYAAVCAMCHGENGQGAYAPKLAGHRDPAALKALIANGVGNRHMPGFSRRAGGPLDSRQISALAAWLVSLDD